MHPSSTWQRKIHEELKRYRRNTFTERKLNTGNAADKIYALIQPGAVRAVNGRTCLRPIQLRLPVWAGEPFSWVLVIYSFINSIPIPVIWVVAYLKSYFNRNSHKILISTDTGNDHNKLSLPYEGLWHWKMGMDKMWQNDLEIIAPTYHPPSSPLASHFEPTISKIMS